MNKNAVMLCVHTRTNTMISVTPSTLSGENAESRFFADITASAQIPASHFSPLNKLGSRISAYPSKSVQARISVSTLSHFMTNVASFTPGKQNSGSTGEADKSL